MRKLVLILVTVIYTFSLYGQDGDNAKKKKDYDFTDNSKGTSMMPIIGDVISAIQYLEDSLGVEVVRIEYDIIQEKKTSYRTLHTGYNYGIVAVGDYRVKKIKLEAYAKKGKKWKLLNTNARNSYLALLSVEPSKTAEYAFDIIIEEFGEGYSAAHYAIIYYH